MSPTMSSRIARSLLALIAFVIAVITAVPASADVERIREKAQELEQKLNSRQYDSYIKSKDPTTLRVYKDFEFILKPNKVEEAREAEGDPYSDRLALYLVEAIVQRGLADYEDDLRLHEMNGKAALDDEDLNRREMLLRMALSADDKERRKIYTAVKPLIELGNVFRNQIATRRVELYQAQGYANYNVFYAEREGLDLDVVAANAQTFLDGSQALYDELFTWVADTRMGVVPRKVRFPDFPFLMTALEFQEYFPAEERHTRVDAILAGMGLGEISTSMEGWDDRSRPGRQLGGGVYAIDVPSNVPVGITPVGGPMDYDETLYQLGVCGVFRLSTETAFEPAYLDREAPTAAMGYLVRWVRDEDAWLREVAGMEGEALATYKKHRGFVRLLEARMLAAQALYEIRLYAGDTQAESFFKEAMRSATGVRLSSTDSKRALEFASQLRSVGSFTGFLMAANLRHHLYDSLGESWYKDASVGELLRGWYARGGNLTLDIMTEETGGTTAAVEPFVDRLQKYSAN